MNVIVILSMLIELVENEYFIPFINAQFSISFHLAYDIILLLLIDVI